MARQGIFTGFTPNDGLGDSLASGAVKVNANFQEIYNAFGDGTNLDANAGAGGTWAKSGSFGISTSKYVGIGTDLPRSALDVEGDVRISGVATGTFKGDGSGLTGVTATGSGVVLKDDGVLIGVAQSINFTNRITVGNVFGGNAEVYAEDYVSYATVAGFATYAPTAGYSTVTDYATSAGVATYAASAGIVTFATTAGVVTYAGASGVATYAGEASYAPLAGVSSYTPLAGLSTIAGYAQTAGIATVAQNLTGTPSITIDNINSAIGVVTMPGQGSKMRFDYDSTFDMPSAPSWRGMFAFANNSQQAYVSYGTTIGGYQGWRRIAVEDENGNHNFSGVITAAQFSGDASGLFNIPATDSVWRVNATGINTLGNVGIGTTTATEALTVTGNFKLAGRLDGTATDNKLPFLYATYADLAATSAADYHGAFAHVHEYGTAYFAHANRWVQLVQRNWDGTVGTGTDNYDVGVITATTYYGDGSNLTGVSGGVGTNTNINTTGIITAGAFFGDGSGLTGVTAVGSGVVIQEEGSPVGTAATINFVGTAVTATVSNGVATIEITDTQGAGGGVSTSFADGVGLNFGADDDLEIKHDSDSYITDKGGGQLYITGNSVVLRYGDNVSAATCLETKPNGDVQVSGILSAFGGYRGDIWIEESIDDNAAYNVMLLGEGGGGNAYRPAMVDANALTFNPSTNTLACSIFSGSVSASNLYTGTIPDARFPSILPAIDGSRLTNLPTSEGGSTVGLGSTTQNINTTGIITASSFVGDGSGLTGVTAVGSGIEIKDDGTLVGVAATIDFGNGLDVSPASAGVVTVTGGLASGIVTFTAQALVPQVLDTFAAASYSSAEYTVTLGLGTYRQMQKFMVMHDGGGAGVTTTAYYQEYAIMTSPTQIVSISAAYNAGNIEISVTPESGISGTTTCRFTKNLIAGV